MLRISWTEKKSNLEVLKAAGVQRTLMKTIRQRQRDFFGHEKARHRGTSGNWKSRRETSKRTTKTEVFGQSVYMIGE